MGQVQNIALNGQSITAVHAWLNWVKVGEVQSWSGFKYQAHNNFFLHDGSELEEEQEAQGLGILLDKMEDNDHIKLDNYHNIQIYMYLSL